MVPRRKDLPRTSGRPGETAELIASLSARDPGGADRLFVLVYADLRRLAHRHLSRSPPGQTLEPTDVLHEVYLKLAGHEPSDWRSRSHFFAVGAKAMRQILVDHARRKGRQKRGASPKKVPFDERTLSMQRDEDVLAVDEALKKLASVNETRARIVELRFFAGMTVAETAEALGLSKRTVEGHWTYSKAWMRRELAPAEQSNDRIT